MDFDTLLRILSLCVVLAGAETLHGIARTVWMVPRIGKERALKLSGLTGSVLAFGICWLLVPPMQLQGALAHGLLGLALAAFMAAFDLAIGHFVMRKSWHKLWPDFNPATGNFLLYGLLFLCLVPLLVSWLQPQP
jgi:hypothetical protein